MKIKFSPTPVAFGEVPYLSWVEGDLQSRDDGKLVVQIGTQYVEFHQNSYGLSSDRNSVLAGAVKGPYSFLEFPGDSSRGEPYPSLLVAFVNIE